MGSSIYYFAGPSDNAELCRFAVSLGLEIVPPLNCDPVISANDDPSAGPFCFLSVVPRHELHPYGNPLGYGAATDPLLEFLRAYRNSDDLVMGRLHWANDVQELAKATKPLFRKLCSWIKAQWKQLPEGQYIGPEAFSLHTDGANLRYLPQGLNVEGR